jgi:hypothetical protein
MTNTTGPAPSYYVPINQYTILLSTTCVAPEVTYGGGECFSNLSPSGWSVHKIPLSSNGYLNLPINVPDISVRTVFGLLMIALIVSFLILVLMVLRPARSGGIITSNNTMKQRTCGHLNFGILRDRRLHVLVGAFGFIFILAGALLLRVQVNRTISALKLASKDEKFPDLFYYDVQEDSATFWGAVWASVCLMAVNPMMLALGAWKYPR